MFVTRCRYPLFLIFNVSRLDFVRLGFIHGSPFASFSLFASLSFFIRVYFTNLQLWMKISDFSILVWRNKMEVEIVRIHRRVNFIARRTALKYFLACCFFPSLNKYEELYLWCSVAGYSPYASRNNIDFRINILVFLYAIRLVSTIMRSLLVSVSYYYDIHNSVRCFSICHAMLSWRVFKNYYAVITNEVVGCREYKARPEETNSSRCFLCPFLQ